MLSDLDVRTTSNGNGIDSSSLESLSLLLREQQQRHRDNIRGGGGGDVNIIYRSGSAPPTVEGSLNAVGSLSRNSNGNGHGHDEDIRSHPAYIAYYYSHDHLNPRLPPPLLSREDWRASQRFDRNSNSLFSLQPGVGDSQHAAEAEWIEKDTDGLIGLAGVGLGARRKSLADMLQEGLGRPTPKSCRLSRPSSCNTFGDVLDPLAVSDPHLSRLHNKSESLDGLHSGPAGSGMIRVQSLGSSLSQSFASAMGSSLSRSTTPEATIIGRSTASNLPPLGGRVLSDKKSAIGSNIYNGLSSGVDDVVDISDALSELSLSKSRLIDKNKHASSKFETELKAQSSYPFDSPNNHIHTLQQHLINNSGPKVPTVSTIYEELAKSNETEARTDLNVSKINVDEQTNLPRRVSGNLLTKVSSSGSLSLDGSDLHQRNTETHNINLSGFDPGGYYINQRFSTSMTNHLDTGATTISSVGQNLGRSMNYVDPGFQLSVVDPLYVQYLQRPSDFRSQPSDSSLRRSYIGTPDLELIALQKTYLATLLAQQKQQYNMSFLDRADGFDHGVYRSPTYGVGLPNPIHPTVGSGIHIQQDEGISRFPSSLRSSIGGSIENWPTVNGGTVRERFTSLLDEFKNNKTRCFELLEIVDHVVEFSGDQYGSRFIQQKLETASVEEKNKIFPKIIPHARTLMTDVFGNYVIQKFFEHGTESQRQELAGQLTGHVLPLSLQMYGCRVIQKALEVVDVDQQTQMVAELDGSIMKCVRDQNGNHVIQKCIECVPQDRIHFIVSSFYGQVVALSTHPYGCRVIQRVLEHCDDPDTQHIIMEEILRSVCTLAQDQYGNYVVQHILQHGQPLERSTIIKKLAGQIVKMSQQKFASNVVEKCLTFGGLEERQVLVTEMLGSTDENEPLQVMMKDPYGNYVVQKVLETCDNHSRELILSRIKVHLNTLKKYTYGKHIVARVEKLVTTGERRMGFSSSFSS